MPTLFEGQIKVVFEKIANECGGGNYHKVNGNYAGRNDDSAFQLNFYFSQNLGQKYLISKIKEIFKEFPPEGSHKISLKIFDCESDSFEI